MRNLFISLALIFASICVSAQEHLSFKGIPIEGSMTAFCQKLKAKGFAAKGRKNNISMFTGDFTGRNANVGVVAADDGKNVFSVVVHFDPSNEWKILVDTYNYYKDIYTRKYGKPEISNEDDKRNRANHLMMARICEGLIVYHSIWKVAGGEIQLSIEKTGKFSEGQVQILYRDSQNIETKIQNDLDEI